MLAGLRAISMARGIWTMQGKIAEVLRSTLQGDVVVRPDIDPDLIGGMVVRVGDTVYDSSVATRLRHLYREMVGRTVEAIETSRERFE